MSGTLGGAPFSEAQVVLEILADTDDVADPMLPSPDALLAVPASQASVDIAGLGTATSTEPTLLVVNQDDLSVFFRSAVLLDPGGDPIPDYLSLFCNADCLGWQLTTSIGPLVLGPNVGLFEGLATDLGVLDLSDDGPITFQMVVVPEPSTAALLAAGLALLARRRRWSTGSIATSTPVVTGSTPPGTSPSRSPGSCSI